MSIPDWAVRLTGIRYKDQGRDRSGCDCWGVVRLAHRELGHELPSYTEEYASAKERQEIGALLRREASNGGWVETNLHDAGFGDVLTFRREPGEIESHVGMVVGRGMMLHLRSGRYSAIDSYLVDFWLARVAHIYRFVE